MNRTKQNKTKKWKKNWIESIWENKNFHLDSGGERRIRHRHHHYHRRRSNLSIDVFGVWCKNNMIIWMSKFWSKTTRNVNSFIRVAKFFFPFAVKKHSKTVLMKLWMPSIDPSPLFSSVLYFFYFSLSLSLSLCRWFSLLDFGDDLVVPGRHI